MKSRETIRQRQWTQSSLTITHNHKLLYPSIYSRMEEESKRYVGSIDVTDKKDVGHMNKGLDYVAYEAETGLTINERNAFDELENNLLSLLRSNGIKVTSYSRKEVAQIIGKLKESLYQKTELSKPNHTLEIQIADITLQLNQLKNLIKEERNNSNLPNLTLLGKVKEMEDSLYKIRTNISKRDVKIRTSEVSSEEIASKNLEIRKIKAKLNDYEYEKKNNKELEAILSKLCTVITSLDVQLKEPGAIQSIKQELEYNKGVIEELIQSAKHMSGIKLNAQSSRNKGNHSQLVKSKTISIERDISIEMHKDKDKIEVNERKHKKEIDRVTSMFNEKIKKLKEENKKLEESNKQKNDQIHKREREAALFAEDFKKNISAVNQEELLKKTISELQIELKHNKMLASKEVGNLKEQAKELEIKNKSLIQERNSLSRRNQKLNEQILELINRKSLNQSKVPNEQEFNSLQADYEKVCKELEQEKEIVDTLNNTNKEYEDKIAQLENEKNELLKQVEELNNKLKEIENNLQAINKNMSELEQYKESCNQLINSKELSAHNELDEYKKKCEELEDELIQQLEENKGLKDKLKENEKLKDLLEKKESEVIIQLKKAIIEYQEQEVNIPKEPKEEQVKKASDIGVQSEIVLEETNASSVHISDLKKENEVAKLAEELKIIKDKNRNLKAHLIKKETQKKELEGKIETLKEQVDELYRMQQDLSDKNDTFEEKLITMEKEREKVKESVLVFVRSLPLGDDNLAIEKLLKAANCSQEEILNVQTERTSESER